MGTWQHIVEPLHKSTTRDYLGRMTNNKVHAMQVARQYGRDYWDGRRQYGYGGYYYDGRWRSVAQELINIYQLPESAKILDVGCGKGFLLYEFTQLLPQARVCGFDISSYALAQAHPEIQSCLFQHDAGRPYPFTPGEFDLAVSITTLHNLPLYHLKIALQELERLAHNKYLVVESYRHEQELFNLQCWALTCQAFFTPLEWQWLFKEFGYHGDYEFIFFE